MGNHIIVEYINVIPYLILYGNNRQSYYNFIEDEIIKSKYFFTRRCSINFIEKCLNFFSFKLFSKLNFMEIIFYLFIIKFDTIIKYCLISLIIFIFCDFIILMK